MRMSARAQGDEQENGALPVEGSARSSEASLTEPEMTPMERARLAEIDADLQAMCDRVDADLRQRHPELFDEHGQLDIEAASRLLVARSGGKTLLSSKDLLELERKAQASRSAHAS
jgi:hypothetical protein